MNECCCDPVPMLPLFLKIISFYAFLAVMIICNAFLVPMHGSSTFHIDIVCDMRSPMHTVTCFYFSSFYSNWHHKNYIRAQALLKKFSKCEIKVEDENGVGQKCK